MGEYPSSSKDSKYGIYLTTSQNQLTYHNMCYNSYGIRPGKKAQIDQIE